MRILVVDDSKAMRLIVTRSLRMAGVDADITEAENGKEAFDHVAASRFDVVLSDWDMPVMNGLELLTAVRGTGDNTPFLFVTAQWTPEQRAIAEEAGANGIVSKPFTPESLENAIRSAR